MSDRPVRRNVTGHDFNGRAVFLIDGPPARVQRIGGEMGPLFHEVWNTRGIPARIDPASGEPEESGIQLAPPRHGTRIRVLDIPPDDPSLASMSPDKAKAHFAEVGAADASSHASGSALARMHRTERPLMYQGISDRFLAPSEDAAFMREEDGIDFEGEFGIIVDAVPMGTDAAAAMKHIRLIVQINDWSLRAHAGAEIRTGFCFVLAKPACALAPFAVTPEELGDAWHNGCVCLDLAIDWNGQRFGSANGREMEVGCHELVAHAATTRDLVAGTIIGSGTVANVEHQEVGSICISERRAIEIIAHGKPVTSFMRFGERLRREARDSLDRAPFGTFDRTVVPRLA